MRARSVFTRVWLVSFPGSLFRIFLQTCETKSGTESLGTRLWFGGESSEPRYVLSPSLFLVVDPLLRQLRESSGLGCPSIIILYGGVVCPLVDVAVSGAI